MLSMIGAAPRGASKDRQIFVDYVILMMARVTVFVNKFRKNTRLYAAKYYFRDETASDVSQNQQKETCERPAQSDSPAPSVSVSAEKQCGENHPRGEGKHGLVVEN